MGLKDWKKEKPNEEIGEILSYKKRRASISLYRGKANYIFATGTGNKFHVSYWGGYTTQDGFSTGGGDINFPSKEKALTFIKKYMREH